MTQFFTDFRDGVVGQPPPQWSERWSTGNGDVRIVDAGVPAGTGSDRAARLAMTASARYALAWDVVGVVSGDVEVVARMYFQGGAGGTRRRLFVHGSGDAGAERAYFANENYQANFPVSGYVAAGLVDVGAGAALPTGWRWIRIQRTGTTVRVRQWGVDEVEPSTWWASGTHAELTSGWVGFGAFSGAAGDGMAIYVDAFGVGTDGDFAPVEPLPTSPADVLLDPAALIGHRVESWRVEHLSHDGGSRGDLDGVVGGTIEHNVNAEISGGGSLTIDRRDVDVNWLADRLRVWWRVGEHEWPMGTFLGSVPTSAYDDESGDDPTWEVELLDTLTVLAEDKVEEAYALPAGAVVTDAVVDIIEAAGETAAVTPSAETLSAGQTWPAGTSRLRIVNDLLATINYFSLRADGYGRLAADPYRAPRSRPVVWQFAPGAAAIHVAQMKREEDLYEVPNKVLMVTQGDPTTEALVGVATNDDPASPLSTVSRGRTIVEVVEGVEATSQAVLDEIAARRLLDASAPAAKVQFAHAVIPLGVNDIVTVVVGGVERRGAVQTMSTSLEVGALTNTTILEVDG